MSHFARPEYLAFLAVVLAMTAAGFWLSRWRGRAQSSFAGPQAHRWQAKQLWPPLLFVLVAAVLIVIAAARPQWGSHQQTRPRQGIDLVIALDVSQSMQATDVAPSRLGAAQDELASLVDAERGSRIGLVLFAGSAFLRSPLTTDTGAMTGLIRRAGRDEALTTTGSDIGSALDQAQTILEGSQTPGKAVVIVSDGEDFAHGFAEKATALHQKGVAVFTAGVGTAQGTTLTDRDIRGQTHLKTDSQGQPVVTRLNESTLQTIASSGGGRYVRLGDGGRGLLGLRDDLSQLQQTRIADESEKVPIERFQPFVLAALVLLIESWLLPARIALPALRRLKRLPPHPGLAILLVALLLGACGGKPDDGIRQKNAAANRLYAGGDYQGALNAYQALLAQRPDLPELSINAGNALHRLKSYDRAVSETQRALSPADAWLAELAYYELGDHLLAGGHFEQAYDAFRNALLLDPDDMDAKYNLELALAQLAGQQQQQQPQQENPAPSALNPDQPQQPGQSPQETPGQQPQSPAQQGPAQSSPGQASQEATRELQDALKGIDQNLSFEEAVRILDLLRQQQETQRQNSRPQPGTGPDY